MLVSQKSQYALRAIFELSKRYGQGVVRIADIAQAQAIPVRFLEVILNQLKQGGFVSSQRGNQGGYMLVQRPEELTVTEVLEAIQGPIGAIGCMLETNKGEEDCPLFGDCVFMSMWEKVSEAISGVLDTTTFGELVEQDQQRIGMRAANYCI